MKVQTIFNMPSPYRDDFRIKAYTFGIGKKSLCIVGSMRGDEMQQQYVASRLVAVLREAEDKLLLAPDVSISVIPCVNPSSINIEKRFWALDGTDINRMFPGYDQGETTQRIAAGVFDFIKDFEYGVQLASFYLPGYFLPHIRMIQTGFEQVDEARLFGLPYIEVSKPKPFDTVLLNYNWQIWETHAFSLYAGTTDVIDYDAAETSLDAICRFMQQKGLTTSPLRDTETSLVAPDDAVVVDESQLETVKAPHAGLLLTCCTVGQQVAKGDVLAHIIHPYEGREICTIKSPADGTIFFARNKSIAYQNTLLFRMICK